MAVTPPQPRMKMLAVGCKVGSAAGEEAELFWRGRARVRMWSGTREKHNRMWPPPPGGEHEKEFLLTASVPRPAAEEVQYGRSISLLLRAGRAQRQRNGMCVVGRFQRQELAREAKVRNLHPPTAGIVRLASTMRRDPCGHGIDRSLLEAGMARIGRAFRVAAGQCATCESNPWQEDRSAGRWLARGVIAARIVAQQLAKWTS